MTGLFGAREAALKKKINCLTFCFEATNLRKNISNEMLSKHAGTLMHKSQE